MQYSRRHFGKIALAGASARLAMAGPSSVVGGVKLGSITFSFHDVTRVVGQDTVDQVIDDLVYAGCQFCEIEDFDIEPTTAVGGRGGGGRGGGAAGASGGRGAGAAGGSGRAGRSMTPEQQAAQQEARAAVRKWRVETPAEHFHAIRKKLDTAGITPIAYTVHYNDQYFDDEIDASFRQASAMGLDVMSTSTTLTMAERLVPFVEKYKMKLAFHGHANTADPNQFAGPDTFAKALAMSRYYRINLDVGHFIACGFDAIPFIEKNHDYITHLHVKDMKRGVEANLPWGQGDVPIKDILQLLKKNKYPIVALTEMAYPITGTCRDEVKKNMEFMRAALA